MEPDDGFRQPRGLRKRFAFWAGRKVKQLLEGDNGSKSSSTSTHHASVTTPPSTVVRRHGTGQGQFPISRPVHDHLRLRFKASPLPNTTSCVVAGNETASSKPSPPNITIACVDFLGNVQSATTYVKRDLGFQGQIGEYILLSYGDTLYSDENNTDTWRGMTSDSLALAAHDPLVVVDPVLNDDGYPPQFCPAISSFGEDPADCGLGITNAVETTDGDGIMFFLLNHRPNGTNNLVGAGVATVNLDTSVYPPTPSIQRLAKYWWDATCEPWYGDICALRSEGHIYAYGHGGEGNPYVYLTRVPVENATDLSCYEYWNGEGWQPERLQTKSLGEKESMFWQINQGQVVWSNHFGCFIFVYCDNWMNSKVLMKTAQRPEGPWSDATTLYQATPITNGSSIYAAVPHPYFDESGQTLVVTFTNHPNVVQAVKITFG
ncbi:hypothetical protein PV11_08404 [Exophiala sideris]|uniref:DUF4185 domain-containing protein n=1 Tax=Exophiala sideris TaxID=1016849 RepID=A0A0D1YIW1_9EURO|nr:hypothetical protein PV11_08404 [Exophiala sideris]